MNIEDICKLPINEIAAEDCILFLWTTYPMLQEAIQLINAWGFKYKTIGFQWIKLNKSVDNPLFIQKKNIFFGLGGGQEGIQNPV
jgi:N6-adenosine-specific RNA methylase IME4